MPRSDQASATNIFTRQSCGLLAQDWQARGRHLGHELEVKVAGSRDQDSVDVARVQQTGGVLVYGPVRCGDGGTGICNGLSDSSHGDRR